jgi:hypothetical protein
MRTYHQADGLFFQRGEDGRVRVIKTKDGKEPAADGSNVVVDQTMSLEVFASVASTMSASGETSEKWLAAVAFLKG